MFQRNKSRGMGGTSVGGRPTSAAPHTHSLSGPSPNNPAHRAPNISEPPPPNNPARPASATMSFRDRLQAAREMYEPGSESKTTGDTTTEAKRTPGGRFKPDTKPAPSGDSPGELKKLVQDAVHLFDIYHVAEAEVLFQKALSLLEDKTFPGREHMFVQSLGGLALLFYKRSRSQRHDEMEWHRLMIQSVVLQLELVRYCQELTEHYEGIQNERERNKWSWLPEEKKTAEQQQQVLDNLLVESLQQRVAGVELRGPTDQIAHAPVILDTGWLLTFQQHVRRKSETMYTNGLASPRNLVAEDLDSVLTAASELSPTTPSSQPGSRAKKLDCDRVQRTIMKLVRQISSDMRQRYIRKKLSEKMFRETVSSEMIAKCSLMPETKDVLELFENAIIQYNYGVSAEEFRTWNVESCEMDTDSTGNETTSTDTNSDDQSPANLPYLPSLYEDDSTPQTPMEVQSYDFPGVLTVWRAYDKKHHAHIRTRLPPFRPYLLQGFEEFSPLTETCLLSSVHTCASQVSTPSRSSTTATSSSSSSSSVPSPIETRPPNYITENRFQYALASTLVKCAQHLQKDIHSLSQAAELFKHALGILQALPTDVIGRRPLIALILKNVGIIRCTQGDIGVGSQLMHEAMELYSPENDIENVNVAEVWFELGEAYMQQQWKEDTIFEHVMRLVRDELSREFSPEEDVPDDASVDSDMSDCGASYSVCAQEAMSCYKSALAILSRLRRKKEIHTSLYVDVLTKLGDCAIIVSEYERAVLCYEEALYLCQNTLGSVSLANSAHILSMLGTTNFLLGTYSKAATMYETANILQQHLYGLQDNFEMAFTMSMLGNTYYIMKRYHKCVAWCMKAFEIYVNIYKHEIIFVDSLHRWFIAHTLYCLGFAYGHLNFHAKALHNLNLAKNMIEKATDDDVDIQQHVRILKVMADVNVNMDQNQLALGYYQEALDLSSALGDETSVTTLQNQLLNRMAGIHVNTKQYDTAAEYLEQALDCQRNVETSIKGDLIGIMYQLGNTYILSGDMDRAIECFNECYESYQEAHVTTGPDISRTLCHLGTLYHLKGCMQDDNDDMLEYLESSDQYYKDAIEMDPQSPACVQYANFLHQQEQYADSLLAMLNFVFQRHTREDQELHYNGPEQAILPEHLLYDLNDIDEVVLDVRVFARFLGVLCLKHLGLYKDAVDCIVLMVEIVDKSPVALNHSLLGYALIEMGLYQEAAESFHRAAALQHENDVSIMNEWICRCLCVYMVLVGAEYHIWAMATEAYLDLSGPAPTPTTTLPVFPPEPTQPAVVARPLRDSGYYDHAEDTSMDLSRIRSFLDSLDVGYKSVDHMPDILSPTSPDLTATNENVFHEDSNEEWHVEEEQVVDTPQHILDAMLKSQKSSAVSMEVTESARNQYFEDVAPSTDEPETEEWVVEEEITLETPSAILAALSGKLTMENRQSPYESQPYEYEGELKHKTAHEYSSYDNNDYNSQTSSILHEDWSSKNRTAAPPDLLEGLHNNYNYPISDHHDHKNADSNVMKFTTHNTDSNGNGAFSSPSISTREQSRDLYPTTWQSHYDGLNGNSNTMTSTAYSELNANTANDGAQEEEEIWETWETSEEMTIETPAVILQALMASQNKV